MPNSKWETATVVAITAGATKTFQIQFAGRDETIDVPDSAERIKRRDYDSSRRPPSGNKGKGKGSGRGTPSRGTHSESSGLPSIRASSVSDTCWCVGERVEAKYTDRSRGWKPAAVVQIDDSGISIVFDGHSDMTMIPDDATRIRRIPSTLKSEPFPSDNSARRSISMPELSRSVPSSTLHTPAALEIPAMVTRVFSSLVPAISEQLPVTTLEVTQLIGVRCEELSRENENERVRSEMRKMEKELEQMKRELLEQKIAEKEVRNELDKTKKECISLKANAENDMHWRNSYRQLVESDPRYAHIMRNLE